MKPVKIPKKYEVGDMKHITYRGNSDNVRDLDTLQFDHPALGTVTMALIEVSDVDMEKLVEHGKFWLCLVTEQVPPFNFLRFDEVVVTSEN